MRKKLRKYINLFGFVPPTFVKRIDLAEKARRLETLETIEGFRQQLVCNTKIEKVTQQP